MWCIKSDHNFINHWLAFESRLQKYLQAERANKRDFRMFSRRKARVEITHSFRN